MKMTEIGALVGFFSDPALEHLSRIDHWCGPAWTSDERGRPASVHLTASPRLDARDRADAVEAVARFLGTAVTLLDYTDPGPHRRVALITSGAWAELGVTVTAVVSDLDPYGAEVIRRHDPAHLSTAEFLEVEACASGRDEDQP